MLFIDFRKAFDSVNRKALYDTLEDFGIPHKLIKLVKMTLDNLQTKVVVGNQITRSFAVKSGASQEMHYLLHFFI
jgi:sorting nexin-29